MASNVTVGVIGLGKLGLPLLASVAEAGYPVVGYDSDHSRAVRLKNSEFDSPEPGLSALLRKNADKLQFTSDEKDLAAATIAYIIVPTPSIANGEFTNQFVFDALTKLLKAWESAESEKCIVVVSTVMPGTCRQIVEELIPSFQSKSSISVIYSPEFIALGTVIQNLTDPDMVLVGCSSPGEASLHLEIQSRMTGSKPVFCMSFEEAEIAKLLVNAFVTMKISFANSIAEIAEKFGIEDSSYISSAIGSDSRIGRKYLRPGFGFGGPCFPRDVRALKSIYDNFGLSSDLPTAIECVNQRQVERVANKLHRLRPTVESIGIFGLTYKPDSTVTEESQSLGLAYALAKRGLRVLVFDPLLQEASIFPGLSVAEKIEQLSQCELVVVASPFYDRYQELLINFNLMII